MPNDNKNLLPPVPDDAMGICKHKCRKCGDEIPIARHETATTNRMIRNETEIPYRPNLDRHYRHQYWCRRVCDECSENSEYKVRWKWRNWLEELPEEDLKAVGSIFRELVEHTHPQHQYISAGGLKEQLREDHDDMDEGDLQHIEDLIDDWRDIVMKKSKV